MAALFCISDVHVSRKRLIEANPASALDAILELVRAEAIGLANPNLGTPGTSIVLCELTDDEADQLAHAQHEALSASQSGPVQ